MVAEATVDEKEEAATDKEDTSIWCSKQPHHFLLSKVIGLLNLVAFSSGCVKSKLLYQARALNRDLNLFPGANIPEEVQDRV